MNDEEIMMMKKVLKAQDKLIKLINQINELPAAQRKKLEAINLIGPKHDKKLNGLIEEHKEIKKQFNMKIKEQQKSVYEGLSTSEIKGRMAFGKIEK
jgi:hypothetical protein